MTLGKWERSPQPGCVWQDVSVAFSIDCIRCAESPEEVVTLK